MNKQKNIFIHIGKTAGGSISQALQKKGVYIDPTNQAPNDLIYRDKEYENPSFTNFNLNTFDFSFAFVRNPYDRIVSAYHTPWVNENLQKQSFKSFIKLFIQEKKEINFFRWSHVMPYFDTRAKLFDENGVQRVSFIGRFENLKKDFSFACEKMNIENLNLPHIHKSQSRKKYIDYYDNETRDIIEKEYEKDIDYFGYKF